MSVRYLLDTNVLSGLAKPTPALRLMERFHRNRHEIGTSSITISEMRYGINLLPMSTRRELLESFFSGILSFLPVLSYDTTAAEWHGAERARLRLMGRTPPFADGQIASIAATQQLVLVTGNTADFTDFQGLTLENWLL